MAEKETTKEEANQEYKQAVQSAMQHGLSNIIIILCVLCSIYLAVNWVSWDVDKPIVFALITCFIITTIISWRSGKEAVEYLKKHPDTELF